MSEGRLTRVNYLEPSKTLTVKKVDTKFRYL